MGTVYIRWMGAYRSAHPDLLENIRFECIRSDEAACEPLKNKSGKLVSGVAPHASIVGVLIDDRCVFRSFHDDCRSYYKNGNLRTKEPKRTSTHGEAWVHMKNAVKGIVVYGSLDELSKGKLDAVTTASREFNIPVYMLRRKGDLVLIG